jgi:carbon-monoxide dehydrogenase small subunit
MKSEIVTLRINGYEQEVQVRQGQSLLSVLRDTLGMTGTKINCREAECGVCSVEMDGRVVNSCLIDARMAQGADIVTIEGVQEAEGLDILQICFIRHGAVQCGYCIPGMIMAARQLLRDNPRPTRDEIRQGISGVLCRCTGYQKIINAIEDAANTLMQSREGALE